ARAVPSHDRGAVEAGDEEGAGSVALMMFEEVKLEVARTEMLADAARVLEHAEITLAHLRDAAIYARAKHVARNEAGLERLQRLVAQDPRLPIEADVRDVFNCDACFVEAILHRLIGEAAVMFAAREAFLFGGGDDLAVAYKRRGGIAECGQPKDIHKSDLN